MKFLHKLKYSAGVALICTGLASSLLPTGLLAAEGGLKLRGPGQKKPPTQQQVPQQPQPQTPQTQNQTYGPITNADTLWRIASTFRPDPSISINQVMIAIFQTNPDAFADNNINHIKNGSVLRIPTREEILRVSLEQAQRKVDNDSKKTIKPTPQPAAQPAPTVVTAPLTVPVETPITSTPAPAQPAPQSGQVTESLLPVDQAEMAAESQRLREQLALSMNDMQTLVEENTELHARIEELTGKVKKFAVEVAGFENTRRELELLKREKLAAEQRAMEEKASIFNSPWFVGVMSSLPALLLIGGAFFWLSRRTPAPVEEPVAEAPQVPTTPETEPDLTDGADELLEDDLLADNLLSDDMLLDDDTIVDEAPGDDLGLDEELLVPEDDELLVPDEDELLVPDDGIQLDPEVEELDSGSDPDLIVSEDDLAALLSETDELESALDTAEAEEPPADPNEIVSADDIDALLAGAGDELSVEVDADDIDDLLASVDATDEVAGDDIDDLLASAAPNEEVASDDIDDLLAAAAPSEEVASDDIDDLLATAAPSEDVASDDIDDLLAAAAPSEDVASDDIDDLLAAAAPAEDVAGDDIDDLLAAAAPAEDVASDDIDDLLAAAAPAEDVASDDIDDLLAAAAPADDVASDDIDDLLAAAAPAEDVASDDIDDLLASATPDEEVATDDIDDLLAAVDNELPTEQTPPADEGTQEIDTEEMLDDLEGMLADAAEEPAMADAAGDLDTEDLLGDLEDMLTEELPGDEDATLDTEQMLGELESVLDEESTTEAVAIDTEQVLDDLESVLEAPESDVDTNEQSLDTESLLDDLEHVLEEDLPLDDSLEPLEESLEPVADSPEPVEESIEPVEESPEPEIASLEPVEESPEPSEVEELTADLQADDELTLDELVADLPTAEEALTEEPTAEMPPESADNQQAEQILDDLQSMLDGDPEEGEVAMPEVAELAQADDVQAETQGLLDDLNSLLDDEDAPAADTEQAASPKSDDDTTIASLDDADLLAAIEQFDESNIDEVIESDGEYELGEQARQLQASLNPDLDDLFSASREAEEPVLPKERELEQQLDQFAQENSFLEFDKLLDDDQVSLGGSESAAASEPVAAESAKREDSFIEIDSLLDEAENGGDELEPYSEMTLELGLGEFPDVVPGGEQVDVDDDPQGISKKLDLARAYMEIDDADSTRAMLKDVIDAGDEGQRQEAEKLLKKLG